MRLTANMNMLVKVRGSLGLCELELLGAAQEAEHSSKSRLRASTKVQGSLLGLNPTDRGKVQLIPNLPRACPL